jgi:hypothetical protein
VSAFTARLRLPGQSRIPLGVEVDISDEVITLSTGERTVAQWKLAEIDVDYLSDGFHIGVNDEQVVLSVTEPGRFADELGVSTAPPQPIRRAASPRSHAGGMVEELRRRTTQVATILANDSISPQRAFAEWLALIKDLNSRHSRGAMPTPLYHELNTQLLDLIPGDDITEVS